MNSVNVIGRGRVGRRSPPASSSAASSCATDDAELVLLCVPDRAIAEVAAAIEPGPWVAHVSGATPLAALDPHERRFSVHPLQTFTLARGPEQLDGAWAAVTAESDEARARGLRGSPRRSACEPFDLADVGAHALPRGRGDRLELPRHALPRRLAPVRGAGAPPEALVPLMTRTIENDFELTGPISRGDWAVGRGAPRGAARRAPGARADVPRRSRRRRAP